MSSIVVQVSLSLPSPYLSILLLLLLSLIHCCHPLSLSVLLTPLSPLQYFCLFLVLYLSLFVSVSVLDLRNRGWVSLLVFILIDVSGVRKDPFFLLHLPYLHSQ